jgi:hypothetical protein
VQPRNTDGLICLGVLALPLAGLLGLVGLYSTSKVGRRGILSSGDNQAIVATGYFVSQLLGNGLALMPFNLRRYGFVRLSSKQQRESFSFGREVLSIVGVALTLSGLGVYAYAIPALS